MSDESFGARLRRAREAAGLSQQELAERAGLTVNGISQLERGIRKRPYPHTVRVLADALDLDDAERGALIAAVPSRSRPIEPSSEAAIDVPPVLERSTRLPTPGPLFGRDEDLASALAALGETHLLTLTGPGGVGKTTLAVAIAEAAAPRFADGAAFVSLASVTRPDLVTAEIADRLGIRPAGHLEAGQHLARVLADLQLLLVLDNLEHVLDAATDIADLLAAAPGLRVLATSRAPLRLRGERVRPVAPLPPPALDHVPSPAEVLASPAGALLVEQARAHDPRFAVTASNAAAVAAICRRLDGLPLALELAAGWLSVLPPTELLARLDDALPLLSGGPRDLPERQRTMRDTVAWSYALLDPDDQRRFRRLAWLRAPWTLATAEAVLGEDATKTVQGVGRLAERSLVVRDADIGAVAEVRFRMLETIRAFGVEQLEATGEADEVDAARASWALEMVREAEPELQGPDQDRWLAHIAASYGDLAPALEWWRHRDLSAAVEMAWRLRLWWYIRSPRDGQTMLTRLLEAPLAEADRARCSAGLALVSIILGDPTTATQLVATAESLAPAGDVAFANAVAVVGAVAAVAAGNRDDAQRFLDGVSVGGGDSEDAFYAANATLMRVRLAFEDGDLDAADRLLHEADLILERHPVPWNRTLWCNMAAGAALRGGRFEEALEHLRRSVALSSRLGDIAALVYALTALAEAYLAAGRPLEAARAYGATEAFERRFGVTSGENADPAAVRARRRAALDRATAEHDVSGPLVDDAWDAGSSEPLDATLEALLGR